MTNKAVRWKQERLARNTLKELSYGFEMFSSLFFATMTIMMWGAIPLGFLCYLDTDLMSKQEIIVVELIIMCKAVVHSNERIQMVILLSAGGQVGWCWVSMGDSSWTTQLARVANCTMILQNIFFYINCNRLDISQETTHKNRRDGTYRQRVRQPRSAETSYTPPRDTNWLTTSASFPRHFNKFLFCFSFWHR